MRYVILAGLVPLLLGACASPTAPCDAPAAVTGTWRYGGAVDAPVAASMAGTLEITSSSCDGFAGRLDLVQTTPLGQAQRLAGPVNGRVIGAGSIRFDAYLEAVPRQHLATLSGDTISGTWVAVGTSGSSSSGSFGGKREVVR